MTRGTEKYGKFFWNIWVTEELGKQIFVMADELRVMDNGTLLCLSEKGYATLAIAPGRWFAYYAASVIDGGAVSVEHWD